MTKLMTAYVIFNQLKLGNLNLYNQCLIGRDAWKRGGSTMFLNYRDIVTINQLLKGLLVVSGNDAAVALAEVTSGSVKEFAKLMNETARRIGLENSHFKNPHGLNQKGHYMSVRDIATLSKRIAQDFPEHMHYFTTNKFTYADITQRNRNPLFSVNYQGLTGMKTGYTSKGKYGVVSTATRNGRKLIAVINGAVNSKERAKTIISLLNYGFYDIEKIKLFDKNCTVSKIDALFGKTDVELVSRHDILINLPKNYQQEDLVTKIIYKDPIHAPINKNEQIATLLIEYKNNKIEEIPLFSKENIDKVSYLNRIFDLSKFLIKN